MCIGDDKSLNEIKANCCERQQELEREINDHTDFEDDDDIAMFDMLALPPLTRTIEGLSGKRGYVPFSCIFS